jgi:hypothetical protein
MPRWLLKHALRPELLGEIVDDLLRRLRPLAELLLFIESTEGTRWMNWSSAYRAITACGSSNGGRRPVSALAASTAAPIKTSSICTARLVFESTWVTEDSLSGKRMVVICVSLNSTSSWWSM